MADDLPAREQDKFVLRLPPGMRMRIKRAAEVNKRSMNAEILSRLEGSFEAEADMYVDGPGIVRRTPGPPTSPEDAEAILAAIKLLLLADGVPADGEGRPLAAGDQDPAADKG